MAISKKPSNTSKMASDQNEKCTVGIEIVKTLYREVKIPLPEQQGKSLIAWVALICLPFLLFFLFFFQQV